MSFIQAQKTENIFYMVADKKSHNDGDIKRNSQVSFTTWFDKLEKGGRLTSNRVHAEILEEAKAQEIVKKKKYSVTNPVLPCGFLSQSSHYVIKS